MHYNPHPALVPVHVFSYAPHGYNVFPAPDFYFDDDNHACDDRGEGEEGEGEGGLRSKVGGRGRGV